MSYELAIERLEAAIPSPESNQRTWIVCANSKCVEPVVISLGTAIANAGSWTVSSVGGAIYVPTPWRCYSCHKEPMIIEPENEGD